MNKTYANIILFIVVVLIFCIASYLYINDNNKKVIEKFSDTDIKSLNFSYTNEEDDNFRYQVDFYESELLNLAQRPFKLFNDNHKITLFEKKNLENDTNVENDTF